MDETKDVKLSDGTELPLQPELELVEFPQDPAVIAAAEQAVAEMKTRSFSGRNPALGKMVNCQVCNRRHRLVDVAPNGEVLINKECEQKFKELYVDEDLETGKLELVVACPPLPHQKQTQKMLYGAAAVKGKRKSRRPNATGNQIVELTRKLMKYVNTELFTEPTAQMMEARRFAVRTIENAREREAKRIRKQQRKSRRINRER